MVKLDKYHRTNFDALNAYKLSKSQSDFTASIHYCVNERKDEEDPLKTIVTVLYNNRPVGFFVLDRGKDKLVLTDNSASILIRSFSINPSYQRKGIGTKAMVLVPQFLKKHIPDINEIVLSVNVKNKNAYQVYINAGYIDNNKTIVGKMGGQHVLSRRI